LPPVISIVGQKNCGKTILIEKLIAELTSRNYQVGTVKHDVHGFDIDKPGKDSWRHTQAGASTVVISSPNKIAMVKQVKSEESLDAIVNRYLNDVDLVLTEGFKKEAKKKIEIIRQGQKPTPLSKEDEILLIATDISNLQTSLPVADLNNPVQIVKQIEIYLRSKSRKNTVTLTVNQENIPLNAIMKAMVKNTTLGMIKSLKGVRRPKKVKLEIDLD
jgi:molybdopterin-guanine dinucleotide biosynthesis protein B